MRDQSAHPKIVAIANQKGGVGKTTTTINLAAGLCELGLTVLIIDLDPQGNASTGMGIEAADRKHTSYDLLLSEGTPQDLIKATATEGLYIVPATVDLSSADVELVTNEKRSFLLHQALHKSEFSGLGFDFILIDCPPSLNLLTVNALVAADSVLVPLQSEFFALEGLSQLMLTIREVRQISNSDLRIEGVVLTMYDQRNNLSLHVEQDARDTLGDLVFRTVIPRNVRVSESPSFSLPVLAYDSTSKGAAAYRELAAEVLNRNSMAGGLNG